jgi:hypothetical protein
MTDRFVITVLLVLVCSATIELFDPEVPFLLMGPMNVDLLD